MLALVGRKGSVRKPTSPALPVSAFSCNLSHLAWGRLCPSSRLTHDNYQHRDGGRRDCTCYFHEIILDASSRGANFLLLSKIARIMSAAWISRLQQKLLQLQANRGKRFWSVISAQVSWISQTDFLRMLASDLNNTPAEKNNFCSGTF